MSGCYGWIPRLLGLALLKFMFWHLQRCHHTRVEYGTASLVASRSLHSSSCLLRLIVTLSCAHETSISNQSPGVHDEFRLSCSTHDLPARLAKRQLVPKKGLIRQQPAIPTSSNLLFPLQLFDSSEGILLANGCVPNAFFSTEN